MPAMTHAICMMAGSGSRLMPITNHIPKPVVPICNTTPASLIMRQVAQTGVKNFVASVSHRAEIAMGRIQKDAGDLNIEFYLHPLHGPGFQGDPFAARLQDIYKRNNIPCDRRIWVICGDNFSPDMDFSKISDAHDLSFRENPDILLSQTFKIVPLSLALGKLDIAVIDENNMVKRFAHTIHDHAKALEAQQETKSPDVISASEEAEEPMVAAYATTRILESDFFARLPESARSSGYLWGAIAPQTKAIFIDAPWWDIATPDDIWLGQWKFLRRFGPDGTGSLIDKSATAENCRLDHVVIGEGCRLRDVEASWSVFMPYTYVNLRPCPAGIRTIKDSILGGKIEGGSMIDAQSLGAEIIDKQIVVPSMDPDETKMTVEPLRIKRSFVEKAKAGLL